MRIGSILVKVINRLDVLANDEYEKKIGHTENWRAIDGLTHSDAIGDQFDLWSLREQEVQNTLARLSIDPKTYEYDLKTTLPSVLCLVELWRMFKDHEPILEENSVAMWLYCIEKSLPEIDRLAVAWGYQQVGARKRAKTASGGAEAKNRRQRQIIEEAIIRFDPGPGKGLSKSRRAELIRQKATAAKDDPEDSFPCADRLPKDLRKYLS